MIQSVTTSFDTYKYLPSTLCNIFNILLPIIFLYLLYKRNNNKIYKMYIPLAIVLLIVSFIISFQSSVLGNCDVVCYDPNPMEIIVIPIILLSFLIACPVGSNVRILIISLIPSILLLLYTIFTASFSVTLIAELLFIIIRIKLVLLPVYFYKK